MQKLTRCFSTALVVVFFSFLLFSFLFFCHIDGGYSRMVIVGRVYLSTDCAFDPRRMRCSVYLAPVIVEYVKSLYTLSPMLMFFFFFFPSRGMAFEVIRA